MDPLDQALFHLSSLTLLPGLLLANQVLAVDNELTDECLTSSSASAAWTSDFAKSVDSGTIRPRGRHVTLLKRRGEGSNASKSMLPRRLMAQSSPYLKALLID
jgi:hypothetical protein